MRHKHPLERLLRVAELSRSTFYYHLKALDAVDPYAELKQLPERSTLVTRAAMATVGSPRPCARPANW